MSNEMLAVMGGLVTFLLSVNAYYFKDIVSSLRKIELQLVRLTSEHDNNMELIRKHDRELDRLSERIHTLEGALPTLRQFIEGHVEKD